MFNGKDLTDDRFDVGLINTESNEDIPAVSTRFVLNQASVNIFNKSLQINLKKNNTGNALPAIFTGDTKLSRLTRFPDTSQILSM